MLPAEVRVYLPTTLPRLCRPGALGGPAPLPARAVTEALRAEYADVEEQEYAAFLAAAADSAAMLRADAEPVWRRVVLAADVPPRVVRAAPERGPGGVSVLDVVPPRAWAAVHADDPTAAAAVAAVARDPAGDPAALDALALQWWAVQEIPELCRAVPPAGL